MKCLLLIFHIDNSAFDTIEPSIPEVSNMKRIRVELSNKCLITPSGLTLVGAALGKSDLVKCSNRVAVDKKRS